MHVPQLAIPLIFSALLSPVLSWSSNAIETAINPRDILPPECSVDTSTSAATDWALSPAWQTSMKACLSKMNSSSWDGNLCTPVYPDLSKDKDPQPNFLFWKAHARNFKDGQDCYNMCEPCLLKGIEAGLAVTTYCHYAAYTVGRVKATCQMGFDYHDSGTGGSW